MDAKVKKKAALKERRKLRVRKKIVGTTLRPRMSVYRTDRHVYVQVIDDSTGHTLISASSFEKANKVARANKEACHQIGITVAERCKKKNILKVAFDKNGNNYHGRIKCVAEGAREGGLDF